MRHFFRITGYYDLEGIDENGNPKMGPHGGVLSPDGSPLLGKWGQLIDKDGNSVLGN